MVCTPDSRKFSRRLALSAAPAGEVTVMIIDRVITVATKAVPLSDMILPFWFRLSLEAGVR